jgi:methyl-accepting chemotaxis protein
MTQNEVIFVSVLAVISCSAGFLFSYLKYKWTLQTKIGLVLTSGCGIFCITGLYLAYNEFSILRLIIATGIAAVCVVVLVLWLMKVIVTPIAKINMCLASLTNGDFTQGIDLITKDELGEISGKINNMISEISALISSIKDNSKDNSKMAEDLSNLSAQMASSAEEMETQSVSVAGTTEEMSANISSMASAAEEMSMNVKSVSSTSEQMSQNMNMVASAIEEMSTAINDVALRTKGGSDIAADAMEMANSSTETMNVLGRAAQEIGQVTDLIKRIAEQTNMLALNATIEAASAGDAGKGFAVVANEIKELASQSAQAAEEITNRIEEVQTNSEAAVKVIADISDIIGKINESSMVITRLVEQQKDTANEISGSVQQANTGVTSIASSIAEVAKGTNDVARSAAESVKGVTEISSNIHMVSKAVGDSSAGARQLNVSASELAKVAAQIQEMAGKFRLQAA